MGLGHGDAVESDGRARERLASAARATGLLKATGGENAGLVRVSSRLCLSVEHGDYNGTDLFGIGLDRYLWLAFAPNELGIVRAFSADFAGEGIVAFDPARVPLPTSSAAPSVWARFPLGAHFVLERSGRTCRRGFDVVIASDIPSGGMSRSAALSLALLLATMVQNRIALPGRLELARLAQAIENDYTGSPCGLLDPLMIAFARAGIGVHYSPASDTVRSVDWGGAAGSLCVLSLDTGRHRHGLGTSTYSIRRRECDALLSTLRQHLGVASLADAVRDDVHERAVQCTLARHPELLPRLRYLRGAVQRFPSMVAAFARGDAASIGSLVRKDGISLRDDYAISGPELETMCDLVRGLPQVHGERMLGGGDCGASGAIVDPAGAEAVRAHVEREYPLLQPAYAATFAVRECRPADGITFLPIA